MLWRLLSQRKPGHQEESSSILFQVATLRLTFLKLLRNQWVFKEIINFKSHPYFFVCKLSLCPKKKVLLVLIILKDGERTDLFPVTQKNTFSACLKGVLIGLTYFNCVCFTEQICFTNAHCILTYIKSLIKASHKNSKQYSCFIYHFISWSISKKISGILSLHPYKLQHTFFKMVDILM